MIPAAIVIGLHQNGLGVARALGRARVPVIAISGEPDDKYGATRYAHKIVCPDFRGVGLIDTLQNIGRSLDQPGVLIPTTDRGVQLISEHRHLLEPHFRHSLPEHRTLRRLLDKTEIGRFAEAHNFITPRTFDLESEDDLDAHIDAVEFPCILKPRVKTPAFVRHAPQKAFLIRSAKELRDTYRLISQWEATAVIQEWIAGPDTQLVFCLYFFDSAGNPAASFTGRKVRQFIPYCGTAASAEPWHDDVVYEAGVRFFQAAGYRGFGAIEFKKSKDGRYCLIEPTVGRTEHLFALAAANGINLPLVGYCEMAGLPLPERKTPRRSVMYLDWRRDTKAARFYRRAGELTTAEWLTSVRGPKQYALFAWDDPAPYLHFVRGRMVAAAHKASRTFNSSVKACRSSIRRRLQRSSTGTTLSQSREPQRDAVHLSAALDWLCAAQDAGEGGVARAFNLDDHRGHAGWQAAYPETTGYIVPTLFDCARLYGREDLRARAARMAEWLIDLQTAEGGIPGSVVGQDMPPVVFNTGMVLLGWCRAFEETGSSIYVQPITRAAAFLASAQDKDGAWRRFSNFWGELHPHAYDVLVSWPLLLADRAVGDTRARDAAIRNIEFTLTLQQPNGWFGFNALRRIRDNRPLTHTIGYATEGLLNAGLVLGEKRYIDAARCTADALLDQLRPDGFLAGEFNADWSPAAPWSCLTGTSQMSAIWAKLFELNGERKYLHAALAANRFVKLTQDLESVDPGVRGGIAGSHPVHGDYGRCQHLNWAAKYFIDALLAQERRWAVEAARTAQREWSADATR